MFGFVGSALDALGGGGASTYAPVKVGAAPVVSEQQGGQAIQQQAGIQQGAAQRAALGMASGTGSEASKLAAINAGGTASAQIGAQATQARAALYQQIQGMNAGFAQQHNQQQEQADLAAQQANIASAEAAKASRGKMIGGLLSAAGTAAAGMATGGASLAAPALMGAMASDERMKEGVRSVSRGEMARALHDATDEFGGVEPVSYKYKDDTGLPTNRRIGVMAQEMEHTGTVSEAGDGHKQIDMAGALSLALAASADLHDRVEQLEARRGKGRKRG